MADRVRAGLYGQVGNKGAVAIRLELAETSVCVMSLHLESGPGKAMDRAAQLQEVLRSCFSSVSKKTDTQLYHHKLLVLAGDFNFRLALPEGSNTEHLGNIFPKGWPNIQTDKNPGCVGEGISRATTFQSNSDIETIFARYDELKGTQGCVATRDALQGVGLVEGPIMFPPTYKLKKGINAYDGERVPAWCDRVFHTKVGIVRRKYCALGAVQQSDHRPVCAFLETDLLAMPGSSVPTHEKRKPIDTIDLLGGSEKPDNLQNNTRNGPISVDTNVNLLGDINLLEGPETTIGRVVSSNTTVTTDLLGVFDNDPGVKTNVTTDFATGTNVDVNIQLNTKPYIPNIEATGSSHVSVPIIAPNKVASPPASASSLRDCGHQSNLSVDMLGTTIGGQVSSETSVSPSITRGQIVFAEYAGGWYYANVLKVTNGICDVAWRRPRADQWGHPEIMQHYLCSTDADETLHGDGLTVATQIRLPGNNSTP